MIKFEDKYVRFRWSDELKGKKCFVANNMAELRKAFEHGIRKIITEEYSEANPFKATGFFSFAYYDPNYDNKIAFEEGKQIQCRTRGAQEFNWGDVMGVPTWDERLEYRVKPEESGLKWTDLDIGDIIESFDDGHHKIMVTEINYEDQNNLHIFGGYWIRDKNLKDWKKIER